MFDVLIIGAGPSGSMAATVLARAGARVCIVDRAAFPRPKLCGDTLNPGAVAVLRRLGMADAIERRALPLDGMLVTGEDVAIEGRYPAPLRGLAMRREELDTILVQQAVNAGAQLREQVRARAPLVRSNQGPLVAGVQCVSTRHVPFDILAPVTIAADGRRSTLALSLGLTRHPESPRRWAIGAHATGVSGLSSLGEMHIRRGRYIGVAPLPGNVANVCLVRPVSSAGDGFRDPCGELARTLDADPLLRERFASARFLGRPTVIGPLAVDEVPRAPMLNGLLLAGDAAGFVDPMTGDGLRFALRGGELAAQAALRALERGWDGVHEWLAAARRDEFGRKWRFNRMLRGLVGAPSGVRAATIGARFVPGVVRALVRHASDCGLAGAGEG